MYCLLRVQQFPHIHFYGIKSSQKGRKKMALKGSSPRITKFPCHPLHKTLPYSQVIKNMKADM